MAAGRIVLSQYFPARDRNGRLVPGALLYVYENGTTTKASIFSNSLLTTPLANPVEANASGQFPAIWASDAVTYTLSITAADGSSIGNPSVFDDYSVSTEAETASVALAEAASLAAEAYYEDILALAGEYPDPAALATRAAKAANGSDFASPTTVPANIGLTDYESDIVLAAANLPVNPAALGLFTNATVTTATLKAAIDYAFANKRPIALRGAYAINATIATKVVASGGLHLHLEDDVAITVDPGATAFDNVIGFECDTVADFIISGPGTLTIDCNNKAGCGLYFRHLDTTYGGVVDLQSRVKVANARGSATTQQNGGVVAIGRFFSISMNSPEVDGVTRLKAAGESSGITCDQYVGPVIIRSPKISNVQIGAGTGDADGIKLFGLLSGTEFNERLGSSSVTDGTFINCQGRALKAQDSHCAVVRPLFKRDAASGIIAITESVEADFQFGNGYIEGHRCEYKKDGATSPVGSGHSVIVFQQTLDNAEMAGRAVNGTVVSDIAFARYALLVNNAGASLSETVVDGLDLIPAGGLSTTMLTRAVLETNTVTVAAKTDETIIRVKNVRGPNTTPLIGYTGYASIDSGTATAGGATTLTDSGQAWTTNEYAGFELRVTSGTGSGQRRTIASNTGTELTVSSAWGTNPDATSGYGIFNPLSAKLTWDAGEGCHNTLPAGSNTKGFGAIADQVILEVKEFRNIAAPGYLNAYINAGFVCDFEKLTVGTVITVDLSNGTFNNQPSWGSSGYAHIRVEGQWFDGDYKTIFARVGSTTYFTQTSGGAWV